MLFIAATMLSVGCKKDDDKDDDPPSGNFKGSVSLLSLTPSSTLTL